MLFSKLNFPRFSLCWYQLSRLLLRQQVAISLTVESEGAPDQVLSAYARGVRHFPRAVLDYAELYQVDLRYIVLTGAKLSKIDFWEADLRGADFSYADLSGANLIESNLAGVNFLGANLAGADLIGANLAGAVLRNACLRNSDLSGADLMDADLTGADLEGAILDQVRWTAEETRAW